MNTNIVEKIKKLKEEKNAIILAHYYQNPEIQDIADYVGDSYYLSKVGMESKADVIVFCGVKFMAEGAKILSPEKRVLLTHEDALCCMALMADEEGIEEIKKKHPKAKVVCYVNSSSEVKAVSDVCCTSSSALNIINNLDTEEIIFVPDKNLGSYIAEKAPNKKITLWHGCCNIHDIIEPKDIIEAKNKHGQDIVILAHPECNKEVRDMAHYVGSTSGIIDYATQCEAKEYLIVTDEGVIHELKKKNPNKTFYSLGMRCNSMKITTLDRVYNCLLNMEGEIFVDEDIRIKAYNALDNMHKLGS